MTKLFRILLNTSLCAYLANKALEEIVEARKFGNNRIY